MSSRSSRDLALLAAGAAVGIALAEAVRLLRRRASKVWILVDFEPKDSDVNALRDAILPHVKASRGETGCLRFQMHRPCHPPSSLATDKREKYTLVEEWASMSALQAHEASPHFNQHVPTLAKSITKITKLVAL